MNRNLLRVALLAGGVVSATVGSARADDKAGSDPCAPRYRTICVKEWVPEKYETTRTVYKKECHEEKYTAYRCETVKVQKQREVCYYERVPVEKEIVRKVCVRVPCEEERIVCEKHWVCKPEEKIVRKCVDKGHWECREVPCGPSILDRLKSHFHKDCCDPCADKCATTCCKTKTVRCWVPCPTWEEHKVTCMKRVCETRQVKCKVKTCKTEWREEKCKVTCYECVQKKRMENYTVCETKRVPYEAVRKVVKCVPVQEKVTCCRMVCRMVEKKVPCCDTDDCCKSALHKLAGLFKRHCCKDACCETKCCK